MILLAVFSSPPSHCTLFPPPGLGGRRGPPLVAARHDSVYIILSRAGGTERIVFVPLTIFLVHTQPLFSGVRLALQDSLSIYLPRAGGTGRIVFVPLTIFLVPAQPLFSWGSPCLFLVDSYIAPRAQGDGNSSRVVQTED